MKIHSIFLSLGTVSGLATQAFAIDLKDKIDHINVDSPVGALRVGDSQYQVPFALNEDGKTWSPSISSLEGDGFTIRFDPGRNEINPDPYIFWGFSVFNSSGVPQTYSFLFSSPLVLGTPCYSSILDGGFVLTDATGDGASMGATTPYVTARLDAAVDLTSGGFTLSDPPGGPRTVSGTYLDATSGMTGAATFSVNLTFGLTPGDSVAATGIYEIKPAACPDSTHSVTLLILGGITMAGVSGRRMSRERSAMRQP